MRGNFIKFKRYKKIQFLSQSGFTPCCLILDEHHGLISVILNQSGSDAFDKIIDKSNEKDGADISKRDFTGADFTAWADALFFPDKPYEDRGIHPSGVGINRYIKPSQLSTEARSYLKKQGRLHWLNILSPHLFGFSKIKLNSTEKGDYYGNFAALLDLLVTISRCFPPTPKIISFALHNYNNLKLPFFDSNLRL